VVQSQADVYCKESSAVVLCNLSSVVFPGSISGLAIGTRRNLLSSLEPSLAKPNLIN
jgi:hypothetical protein